MLPKPFDGRTLTPLAQAAMENEEDRTRRRIVTVTQRIYLAASWSRKLELQKIALELRLKKFEVTSRWLHKDAAPASAARMDVEDVIACDTLIRFSDPVVVAGRAPDTVPFNIATGARHFEFGYAYALKKRTIVIGGHQNIFDSLPRVEHFSSMEELWKTLMTDR